MVVASPPMIDVPALAPYRAKCIVIPYGLDADRHRATPAVTARAKALRDQIGGPVVLFVGRLVRYKGLEILLRAVQGLDVHAVIVGHGPLRDSLDTIVRDLRLEGRVHLTGEVSDDERLAWLYASDALVLPSTTRQEAFGISQLEAMLCSRPVISTDVPTGVPWVNVDGQTGLSVPAGDVDALRTAIQRLSSDADLRQALGTAARARVLETFNADRMRRAVLTLYQEAAEPAFSTFMHGPADKIAARAGSRSA